MKRSMGRKAQVKPVKCPSCGSTNVYTTLKSRVCRHCGYRGQKHEFEFEEKSPENLLS